jgi:hypothetical protein
MGKGRAVMKSDSNKYNAIAPTAQKESERFY